MPKLIISSLGNPTAVSGPGLVVQDQKSRRATWGDKFSEFDVRITQAQEIDNSHYRMDVIKTQLVPIAAWWGKGSHQDVFGVFLMAAFHESKAVFQSVCKLGAGLSDRQLTEQTDALLKQILSSCPANYKINPSINPDVWFDASSVWEVIGADLSLSQLHTAAQGELHENNGITLRFPRFIRICDDIATARATTAQELLVMYEAQKAAKPSE